MAPRSLRSSSGRGRGRRHTPAGVNGSQEDLQMQAPLTVSLPDDAPLIEELPTDPPSISPTLSAEQQQEDDSHFPSPNTSPVSVPTETPTTTPIRPPGQRLDSLGLPGRGDHGAASGVGGRVMAGKFKPKPVTRRALVDRVQAQRDEEGRRREREAEAGKERNMNSHGRVQGAEHSRSWEIGGMRGRARGRGDVMGRGRFGQRWMNRDGMGRGRMERNNRVQGEASGVFGVAPAASAKKSTTALSRMSTARLAPDNESMVVHTTNDLSSGLTRPNTRYSKSGTSPVSTRIKQDPDPLGFPTANRSDEDDNDIQSAVVKLETLDPVYPEEQEEGSRPAPRVDIEQINLITDDEDEDSDAVRSSRDKGKGRGLQSKSGLKPVRLLREEHKERVTLVNTEPAATSLTEPTKQPFDHAAYVSSADEADEQLEFSRDSENWPGSWRDEAKEVKDDPDAQVDAMNVDVIAGHIIRNESFNVDTGRVNEVEALDAPVSVVKDRTKRNRRQRKIQPILQTEEDKAEHARHLEDLRVLAEELGGVHVNPVMGKDAGTIDLDDESVSGQPRVNDHEGRLYLFQFPPALPTLVNKAKKENVTDVDPDLMEVEGGPSDAFEAVDLTKPDPEEAVTVETAHGTFQVPPEMVTEEGFVGKLIVRRSGKVQLDWGGILLELGRGVHSDYLSTTMIVEGLDEGGLYEASIKPIGIGTGMGKVMGSFVLKPDFEAMGLM